MSQRGIDTIAVLDFGGQYAHLIANRIRRLGVFTEIHSPDTSFEALKSVKGIIFSGGPSSVYAKDAPKFNTEILQKATVPILGICYGHQLIAHELGGVVEPGKVKEYGIANLHVVDSANELLRDIPLDSPMWMSHGDQVITLPAGFCTIAETEDCQAAAVSSSDRPIFGIQFHPEVTHSQHGAQLLLNFARICDCLDSWNMKSYLPLISERIQEQVGERNVFLLVSGGVDSTVAFVLLNRILGPERVLGLHIDNGMMRLNESDKVLEFLQSEGMDNLMVADATSDFLTPIATESSPETKRKSIGATFLRVKDRELERLMLNPDEWMIAQGTIYPDTIESGGTKNADLIKTHHNRVAEVMELMEKGLLLEPLADLYKDEVRMLGEELGIPHALVWRHPFPGPGLGVRMLCSDGNFEGPSISDVEGLEDYLEHHGLRALLLPIRSVGVQGDGRTYAQPLVLTNPDLDWDANERHATAIANRFRVVNRVVWQVNAVTTSAPLLVRQFCDKPNLDMLREFDAICTEFLQKHNLYESIWQMPVVQLPLRLQGKPVIVIRPVNSSEAMTANFARIPNAKLLLLWGQLRAAGAGALYYDVTHKPPGTIEWE
jgi:GMP synthase (glutamine-hydrolysing)